MSNPGSTLTACLAGLAYAAIVFAAGFALGAVRLLLLVPSLGTTRAVLLEAPVMLALSWWVSARCISRFQVDPSFRARLLMGTVAFLVLQLAEVALARTVFGQSPRAYIAGLGASPGVIGLAAQLAFTSWPLAQALSARSDSHGSQQSAP
jgi:hypothetical protein